VTAGSAAGAVSAMVRERDGREGASSLAFIACNKFDLRRVNLPTQRWKVRRGKVGSLPPPTFPSSLLLEYPTLVGFASVLAIVSTSNLTPFCTGGQYQQKYLWDFLTFKYTIPIGF